MTNMTTQAPPNPTQQPGAPRREETVLLPPEHETAPLEAGPVAPILDSLPLLDHRTRSRAISRRLAPFGHYLAFGDDGTDWLVPLDAKVTHIGRGLDVPRPRRGATRFAQSRDPRATRPPHPAPRQP